MNLGRRSAPAAAAQARQPASAEARLIGLEGARSQLAPAARRARGLAASQRGV